MADETEEQRRARVLALTAEDRALLAGIIRKQLDRIPDQLAKLGEDEQALTAWLAEFAPELLPGATSSAPADQDTTPSPAETTARLEREKAELIAILHETRAQMNAIHVMNREDVLLTPVRASDLYRVDHHQPQNIYRGDQYIGVMFSAEDAAAVVQMLNLHECLACPPSCGSCVHDPDCECYQHQHLHPGNAREGGGND